VAISPQAAAVAGPQQLWFSPPDSEASPRRALTRERVVAEALTVIGARRPERPQHARPRRPPGRGSRRPVPSCAQQGSAA